MIQAGVFQKTIKSTSSEVSKSEKEKVEIDNMLKDDESYMTKTVFNYKKIVSILTKTATLAAQHFDIKIPKVTASMFLQVASSSSTESESEAETDNQYETDFANAKSKRQFLQILVDAKKDYLELVTLMKKEMAAMKTRSETIIADLDNSLNAKKKELADSNLSLSSSTDAVITAKFDIKALDGEVKRMGVYLDQLKQECGVGEKPAGQEKDRIQRLKEEIEALKDASRVLEGEEIPTV
jgi:hypothetical protein